MKQYERKQYLQIIPLTLVCSGYLLLGSGPAWSVVYTPNDNLLKKWLLPLQAVVNWSKLPG